MTFHAGGIIDPAPPQVWIENKNLCGLCGKKPRNVDLFFFTEEAQKARSGWSSLISTSERVMIIR